EVEVLRRPEAQLAELRRRDLDEGRHRSGRNQIERNERRRLRAAPPVLMFARPSTTDLESRPRIAAVIPAYRETDNILSVLETFGAEVPHIYVVDDACPEATGALVERSCRDPRVRVLWHPVNRGVGAATITGYTQPLAAGADIIVKVDGDGQMDPVLIPRLVAPIVRGEAD